MAVEFNMQFKLQSRIKHLSSMILRWMDEGWALAWEPTGQEPIQSHCMKCRGNFPHSNNRKILPKICKDATHQTAGTLLELCQNYIYIVHHNAFALHWFDRHVVMLLFGHDRVLPFKQVCYPNSTSLWHDHTYITYI